MLKNRISQHSKKQRARRQHEKRAAAAVADHGAQQRKAPTDRRRANIDDRELRAAKIMQKRDPAEFKRRLRADLERAGVIKPVFEAA